MELVIGGDQTQKFSSIYLVEQINIFRGQEEGRAELAHSDFLKSIEKDFEEELGQGNISVTSYKDKSNRDSKMYELNFEESLQMLMKESKIVRKQVVEVLKSQQAEIKSLLAPKELSRIEILKIALEAEEKVLLLQAENQKMKPKADFYDTVTESEQTTDIGTVAKVLQLGYGRSTLFSKLRKAKVLMPNNAPYQKYIDLGWVRVVESSWSKPDGSSFIYFKTVVFQKGMNGILKLLK